MNKLQDNIAFNQSSATFNFASLSDAAPELFSRLRNLESVTVSEQVLNDLCFEIVGNCDQWAIVSLMMLFNSLSTIEDAQTRAENFQTICFRWTNEATAAEYAFIDSLRGKQPNADTKQMADALSELLNNPNLPRRIYDGIADGINETFNDLESKGSVSDSPEYVGVVLDVYERTQRKKDEAERAEFFAGKDALDLSEMSAEQLGTNDRRTKAAKIAQVFSEILKDDDAPAELQNGIRDVITEIFNSGNQSVVQSIETSPEYISAVLSDLYESENNE